MVMLNRRMLIMSENRERLLRELMKAAEGMLQGSISETTRTCGNPNCRCHKGFPHGPHTYLTFKTPAGRSSAVYVPVAAREEAQAGVAAWRRFRDLGTRLALDNRRRAVQRWRGGKTGRRKRR